MASKDTPQETPDGREAKGRGFRVLLCPVPPPPTLPTQQSPLPPPPRRSRCWNNPEVPELGEFFDGGGGGWGAPVFGNIAGLARLLRNLESVSKVLGGGGGGRKRGAWGFFLLEVMETVWNEQ